MEWLAGCLSLLADREVFTPKLEASPPHHINHNEHVCSCPVVSLRVTTKDL